MARRIFISGTVASGNYDSETMSADYPDLVMPAITFYDALGAVVTPTAGTVKVLVSADGLNYVETKRSTFNANESYLATRQLPAFAGLAIKCRIVLNGIVGATSFNATVWRGDTDQQIPVTVSANGNERVKVDSSQTGFWDGREFRLNEPLTIAATPFVIRLTAPIDFILKTQKLISNAEQITMLAYRSGDGVAGGTWTPSKHYAPNSVMSKAPSYAGRISVDIGGTFVATVPENYRERIVAKSSGATAQQQTVGAESIAERGLPMEIYYLVFTGNGGIGDFNLLLEERP